MTVIKEKEETPVKAFHFANSNDEVFGIETAVYANDHQVKRVTLSNGKIAVIRELSGNDMMAVDNMLAGIDKPEKRQALYMHTLFHFAVKIDGSQIPAEDFGNLKGKDYNKIKMATQELNF